MHPSDSNPISESVAWLRQPEALGAVPTQSHNFPKGLESWLHERGSMTAALAEYFEQRPSVQVHFSDVAQAQPWEAHLLGIADDVPVFARHITLHTGPQAVLAARSVTVAGGGVEPMLRDLQQTPLAEQLFQDARWRREGEPVPLLEAPERAGRACLWQDKHTDDALLVEEYFLFDPDKN